MFSSDFAPMPALLDKLVTRLAPYLHANRWHIAFSGGMDSSVLLHALQRLSCMQKIPPLHAIHVHHGLMREADTWVGHCTQVCRALNVPLDIEYVKTDQKASLERAAREARYTVFDKYMGENEVLLLAQHQDDQAETLLLRLLRGAGVQGLSAMPVQRPLGVGTLVRPFLSLSRRELLEYATVERLEWVEDPSNAQAVQDRNFLRNDVITRLRARWPQVSNAFARSAMHMTEALEILDECAASDLTVGRGSTVFPWLSLPSLDFEFICSLSDARQRNALRYWLREYTRMPDTAHWAGWYALREASDSANPVWRLEGGELQRAAGRLWWLPDVWLKNQGTACEWPEGKRTVDLAENGQVILRGNDFPEGKLAIRYRQGGEVMLIAGRGRRDLKRLLNERHVPPFLRGRLPLLYCDDELIAVANLSGLDAVANGRWYFEWIPSTSGLRLS
jgi:tRNA(Ile)-lysidine synthase